MKENNSAEGGNVSHEHVKNALNETDNLMTGLPI